MIASKKILFIFIGFSNLVILGLVAGVYMQTHQTFKMSSTIGTNEAQLKKKIQDQCGKDIEKVAKNEKRNVSCNIIIKGREQGSSYTLKTRILVRKKASGDGLHLIGRGSMEARTRYATEAEFCENCKEELDISDSNDSSNVLNQIIDVAKLIDQKAASSVVNAGDKYRKKDLKKRKALYKQKLCKGKWDEESEDYIEYDLEEILDCKVSKLNSKDIFGKEKYYNETLKNELWELALSDDSDLLDSDLFSNLHAKHFGNNLSVTNSGRAIRSYLNWKIKLDDLGPSESLNFQLKKLAADLKSLGDIDNNLYTDYGHLMKEPSLTGAPLSASPTATTPAFPAQINPAAELVPVRNGTTPSGTAAPSEPVPSLPLNIKNKVLDLY